MASSAVDRDRDRLPSFAQSFPNALSRPTLSRNALSDSAAFDGSNSNPIPNQNGKRIREGERDRIDDRLRAIDDLHSPPSMKTESPSPPIVTVLTEKDAATLAAPPSKKRRTAAERTDVRNSASKSPDLNKHAHGATKPTLTDQSKPPPSPREAALSRSESSQSIRSSSATATASKSKTVQTLRSTPSFAGRRNKLSATPYPLTDQNRKFKGAPTDLVISPSASHSSGGYDRSLAPLVQSAPPVPASRFRLHQMQPPTTSMSGEMKQPAAPLGGGYANSNLGVGSVSISRMSTTLRDRDRDRSIASGVRFTNPPKTAGFLPSTMSPLSSALATAGSTAVPVAIRTTVFPPTPTKDNNLSHPLVPPTPVSLRHTLNQPLSSRNTSNPQIPPRSPLPPKAATSASTSAQASAPAPTPSTSTIVGNPQARSAFLAPFEAFYDSLLDAHHLKTWLADQLTRSQALRDMSIEEEVGRRVAPLREELDWLRGRVGELEEVVFSLRGAAGVAKTMSGGGLGTGPKRTINGGASSHLSTIGPPISGRKRRSRSPADPVTAEPSTLSPPALPRSPTPSPGGTPSPILGSLRMATSSTRLDPHPPRKTRKERMPSPLRNAKGAKGEEKDEEKDEREKSPSPKEKEKEKNDDKKMDEDE